MTRRRECRFIRPREITAIHWPTGSNGIMRAGGEDFVCRAVSRLDKDTTGAVLVAKHMLSAGILHEMARERKIKKTYLALAAGRVSERA